MNIWDVGGQQTIRSYWKNYYEATDGVIWVIDSADKRRLDLCKKELHALLKEEVACGLFCVFVCLSEGVVGVHWVDENVLVLPGVPDLVVQSFMLGNGVAPIRRYVHHRSCCGLECRRVKTVYLPEKKHVVVFNVVFMITVNF